MKKTLGVSGTGTKDTAFVSLKTGEKKEEGLEKYSKK